LDEKSMDDRTDGSSDNAADVWAALALILIAWGAVLFWVAAQ